MDPFSPLLSALGLSGAAGLNAYIPLLLVGTPAIAVLSVPALVDFVADKVPAVDHAAHVVGALVHPVATATTAGLGNPVISLVEDVVSLLLSLLALLAPLVALALLFVLCFAVVRAWRAIRRAAVRR